MIAHDVSNTIVLTDGDELLVHDGPTEGPRWRRTLKSTIVAVGLTADAVVSLDDEGQAIWWEHARDRERGRMSAGEVTRAGEVLPNGHVLAVTAEGALLLTPQGRGRSYPWPDAVAAAAAPDGRVLVVDAAGKLGEFSAAGALLQEVALDTPVVALTHSAAGFWIVATAGKVLRLEGDTLSHITSAPAELPVSAIAASPDGAAIAMVLGDALALVLSWPERDTIGQLRYLDRTVAGVAFGAPPVLCVALVGGDGNKLDLASGDLMRTDTFPGREHRRWMVQVSVSPPAEAAASAPTAPAAAAREAEGEAAPVKAGGATSAVVLGLALAVLALLAVLFR